MIGPPAKPPYCLRFRKSFSAAKKFFELNVRSREIAERAAVEVVGARARDRVDDRAGAVALRRAVVAGLNPELLQRVGERERLILLDSRGRCGSCRPAGTRPGAACVPLVDSRSAPGIVLPDSWFTAVSTMPAPACCSLAASRPLSGSSTMRLESTTSLIVDVVMSTVAVSPATVTVSERSPSSSVMLSVRFWFACSTTSVCRTVRKPASSARIS